MRNILDVAGLVQLIGVAFCASTAAAGRAASSNLDRAERTGAVLLVVILAVRHSATNAVVTSVSIHDMKPPYLVLALL